MRLQTLLTPIFGADDHYALYCCRGADYCVFSTYICQSGRPDKKRQSDFLTKTLFSLHITWFYWVRITLNSGLRRPLQKRATWLSCVHVSFFSFHCLDSKSNEMSGDNAKGVGRSRDIPLVGEVEIVAAEWTENVPFKKSDCDQSRACLWFHCSRG